MVAFELKTAAFGLDRQAAVALLFSQVAALRAAENLVADEATWVATDAGELADNVGHVPGSQSGFDFSVSEFSILIRSIASKASRCFFAKALETGTNQPPFSF